MKVFVSYSREDQASVSVLRTDLGQLGHEVWIDQLLLGGQEWWDEILGKIRESDLYVLALSPNAVDSEPCLVELRYAMQLQRPFLPIMVMKTDPNYFPPEVSRSQYIDYTAGGKDALVSLVASLSRLPAPPPLPDPLPPPPAIPESPLYATRHAVTGLAELGRYEQQRAIDALTILAKRPALRDDVVELLGLFRARRDVIADVRDQIDVLLAGFAPPTSPAPPPGAGLAPPRAPTRRAANTGAWSAAFMTSMMIVCVFAGYVTLAVGIANRRNPDRHAQARRLIRFGGLWCAVVGGLWLIGVLGSLSSS